MIEDAPERTLVDDKSVCALKKRDGGRQPRGGVDTVEVRGPDGVLPPGKFFENIGANLCNLGTSGHQKWDGK